MNVIEMLVKVGFPFNYYQMFLKCCLLDIYELEKGMFVIRADGASLSRKENGMSKMDGEKILKMLENATQAENCLEMNPFVFLHDPIWLDFFLKFTTICLELLTD